jgi:hypothetical protein
MKAVCAQSIYLDVFLHGLRQLMRNLCQESCSQPRFEMGTSQTQEKLSVYLKTPFELLTLKAV